jgi:hypothetical protein
MSENDGRNEPNPFALYAHIEMSQWISLVCLIYANKIFKINFKIRKKDHFRIQFVAHTCNSNI